MSMTGQKFALMSGTSMAAPHVAGVAALILQAHPDWSPAAVASAMMTTASVLDKQGSPLLAQRYDTNGSVVLELATPFDFGSGALNATGAIDPGLVFDAGCVYCLYYIYLKVLYCVYVCKKEAFMCVICIHVY